MLTRDEFIEGWLEVSRESGDIVRHSDGFEVSGRRYWALRCACGDDMCNGWALRGAESIARFGPVPDGMAIVPLSSSDGFLLVPGSDAI